MVEPLRRRYHSIPDAERFMRPGVPEALAFDDLAQPGPRFRNTANLIPIESARPGDRQVFAGRGPLPGEPLIDLDSLADLPSVQSIVASTLVRARRDLPEIRELLCFGDTPLPDAETLGHLPGLARLWTAWAPGGRALAVDCLPASLEGLGATRHALPPPAAARRRFEELLRFERLSRLWLLDCWPKDSVAPLAGLTGLVRLHATAPSGWSALRSLIRLEQVAAIRPRLANLRAFSHWERLRTLTLTGGGVRSLAGLEALRGLERLSAVMIAANDLSPLGGLPALEDVRLVGLARVTDLSPLATLPALRRLTFTRASREFADIQHIPSLGVLGSAASLEDLDLEGIVVDDGSLDGLVALPRLRTVRVFGDLGPAVERLRRARPEVEVRWSGAERPPGELVEGVYLRPPAPALPRWWLREDLTGRLGVATNADAEKRLRAALAAEDPALAGRIAFDTEADAVCVDAEAEADVRAIAALIGRLTASRRRRS